MLRASANHKDVASRNTKVIEVKSRMALRWTPLCKIRTRRWEKVENKARPRRMSEIKMNHGTNVVYLPEMSIRTGKAIVSNDAAMVKRGIIITAFSSDGYHPSTNSPTMTIGVQSSSCVCWVSAMRLYRQFRTTKYGTSLQMRL